MDKKFYQLRQCCAGLITHAYGARNHIHELQLRVSGRTTPEMDAEREKIRARYKLIKAHMETLDPDGLKAFIPDRRHFDAETFPPAP